MFIKSFKTDFRNPIFLFCLGWCLVLLTAWVPFAPDLQTYLHFWRAELAASILFFATLSYLFYLHRDKVLALSLSRQEITFIVLPMLAFIIWSGLSMFWSPSWKSALYHTLIWTEYLIFYLVARQLVERPGGYRYFVSLLTVMFLIIALPAIIEYCSFVLFGGTTSLGMRYAKYGEQINTIYPLILVGVLRLNGKKFWVGLLTVSAMWLFIISTLGRTNLLLFVGGWTIVAGSVFVLRRFHKYRRKMAVLTLALITAPLPQHLTTAFSNEPTVPLVKRMSDETHIAYSGNFRKLMTTVSTEMFKTRPVTGVGAGNFGILFNEHREIYASKNPQDVNLQVAENEFAERSHNEHLQILAELGAPGGVLMLWFLAGIGLMILNALTRLKRTSLISTAALTGVCLFLLSSAVSSYSFRLMQNGLLFFFVLAVAAKFLLAPGRKSVANKTAKIFLSSKHIKLGYALGAAACLLLTAQCLIRVTAVYYSNAARSQPDLAQAIPYYQASFSLDPENPTARFAYAMHLFQNRKYSESVIEFEKAVSGGCAGSIDLSYLASAQTLSGDNDAAEKTFAYAARLYPFSTFVRARYAHLLQINGKGEESAAQLQLARQINKSEANTWWAFMTEGARSASLRSAREKDFVEVPKLSPEAAIYAVQIEREVKYPNEKVILNSPN